MAVKSLERFRFAQERDYVRALSEIRSGQKRSHWIWYIFPQIAGMGYSTISKFFAIADFDDAEAVIGWPDEKTLEILKK